MTQLTGSGLTNLSTPLFSNAVYGPVGLLGATLGTGAGALPEARTYNSRTWLNSLQVGSSGSAYNLSIGYAGNADVTSANDSVNDNWYYGYDAFNRLMCANLQSNDTCANPTNGKQTYSYAYDRFGNRWQQNFNGQGTGWQMQLSFNGNNQISSSGYRYDAAGNLVMDALNCYTYDAESRLSSVAPISPPLSGLCGADTMTYLYDAEGRRVARLQNGAVVKQYYYDAAGHMITEANASGATLRAEIYAGDRHLATWNSNATYFNHADWLGTERARTNSSGTLCETITSLPFGDGETTSGACTPTPTFFTGLERDTESGLDHTLNRQYPSNVGRWLTPDPAGVKAVSLTDPQTWNMYAYVRNNPTTLTDPTGLVVQCSGDLSKKNAARCQAIVDQANAKDKKGSYVNPKLHSIYDRLNSDKRVFTIENANLPRGTVGLTTLKGIDSKSGDFGSATIQMDFKQLAGMSAPSPASKVAGFNEFEGLIGKKNLEFAENFGHEGAHGVWALDHRLEGVTLQLLLNDEVQRHAGDPELLREESASDPLLNLTETYAQKNEQVVNQELNAIPH